MSSNVTIVQADLQSRRRGCWGRIYMASLQEGPDDSDKVTVKVAWEAVSHELDSRRQCRHFSEEA